MFKKVYNYFKKIVRVFCDTHISPERIEEIMKLARDDRQSIAQIGSYDTSTFTNLATTETLSGDITSPIVRLQAYGDDCWVSRFTMADSSYSVFDLYIDGVKEEVLTKTSALVWSGGGYNIRATTTVWELMDPAVALVASTKYTTGSFNPPLANWTTHDGSAYHLVPNGVYVGKAPADATGILLPNGAEITMKLDAWDTIGVVGGSLNVVKLNG